MDVVLETGWPQRTSWMQPEVTSDLCWWLLVMSRGRALCASEYLLDITGITGMNCMRVSCPPTCVSLPNLTIWQWMLEITVEAFYLRSSPLLLHSLPADTPAAIVPGPHLPRVRQWGQVGKAGVYQLHCQCYELEYLKHGMFSSRGFRASFT